MEPLLAQADMSLNAIIAFGTLNNPNMRDGHHANMDVAKAAGLRGPVAYSLHYAGLVSDLMAQRHGEAWARRGLLALSFLRPVCAGDRLELRVGERPLQRPEGAPDGALQVDIYNQLGELVAAGAAHA